jgi:hypothetical protein
MRVAASLKSLPRTAGGALGLALLTALAAARTASGTSAQALTSGYHLALIAGTALGGASIVVAAITLRPSAARPATAPGGTAPALTPAPGGHRSRGTASCETAP